MPRVRGNLSQALFDTTGFQVRQRLIRRIEAITQRRLITYVSLFGPPSAMIVHDDQAPLVDLLTDIGQGEPVDLLLNSPGGLPDAAETLLRLGLRASDRPVRVLVPGAAKSAATLMALGADSIVMGEYSQLGPIDPQVFHPRIGMVLPANAVIKAYEEIKTGATLTPGQLAMATQLDLPFVKWCQQAVEHAQSLAAKWLETWMLKDQSDAAKEIARKLSTDPDYIKSHGQVINWKDARDLGLTVEYLSPHDKLWQLIWELYVRTDVMLKQVNAVKAIETKNGGFSMPAVPNPSPAKSEAELGGWA